MAAGMAEQGDNRVVNSAQITSTHTNTLTDGVLRGSKCGIDHGGRHGPVDGEVDRLTQLAVHLHHRQAVQVEDALEVAARPDRQTSGRLRFEAVQAVQLAVVENPLRVGDILAHGGHLLERPLARHLVQPAVGEHQLAEGRLQVADQRRRLLLGVGGHEAVHVAPRDGPTELRVDLLHAALPHRRLLLHALLRLLVGKGEALQLLPGVLGELIGEHPAHVVVEDVVGRVVQRPDQLAVVGQVLDDDQRVVAQLQRVRQVDAVGEGGEEFGPVEATLRQLLEVAQRHLVVPHLGAAAVLRWSGGLPKKV